ncbi:MAG TPA: DNA mismatch repair endonuclease MutL [Polyangiaceae bacterium]|nr:DNA mismatch repair endonuclease MutL [Polyangiaceae bacterium]
MAPKIQLLPPELANQIAAGEVVERPASVVKELLENSLDAGARRVEVSIDGGGLTRIEIQDDGAGMSPEDAALSLRRHATSKLRHFDDLGTLASYGFRGEALPSIASVSRFRLVTRSREQESGSELSCSAELGSTAEPATRPPTPVGAPVGTRVVVEELFHNVPARRKFLRSTATESGHVGDVLDAAALCRPDVAFTLTRDGRLVKNYGRAHSRAERVTQVMGAEEWLRVSGTRGPLRIEGFLSSPERARTGAGSLNWILNDRPIKDRALSASLAHAYGQRLERGRYPRGVVYLEIDPALVDVNVHPQKTEVRFAEGRAVADAIYSLVADAWANREPRSALPAVAEAETSRKRASHWTHTKSLPVREPAAAAKPAASVPTAAADEPTPSGPATGTDKPTPSKPAAAARAAATRTGSAAARDSQPPDSRSGDSRSSDSRSSDSRSGDSRSVGWKRLRFVARARSRFLWCEGEDGFYLFDAWTLHRLVLRSELARDHATARAKSQSLLFPLTVEASPEALEAWERGAEDFRALGLDLRARGERAVSVHALPLRMERLRPELVVQLLLTRLASGEPAQTVVELTLDDWAEADGVRVRESGEFEPAQLVRSFAELELSEEARRAALLSFSSFRELLGRVDPK